MRFETRLHRARVDRGIDLSDLSVRTRLSPHVLRTIDEGRFAELPPGIYARSYVRAFASAVGLEPTQIVEELADMLPPVQDPLDGLREAVREARPVRREFKLPAVRGIAAAFDAAVLSAITATLLQIIAITCGVHVTALMNQAGVAVSTFCAIPAALYFVVFGGVGGRTPGACLCRLPEARPTEPLRLRTILLRAVWR